VAGAASLVTALREEFPPAPRTVVVGLLREKDPREMLEALDVGAAARVICCRPPSQRARPPDEVAAVALGMGVDQDRLEVVDAVADAVDLALELTGPDEQIVITGSLYVVGAARAILLP
jgi:dihydrofolate synthase / folylpolyglutamate synthase